jgi:formylglycine-generating enzyme required for sulfatase activity
MRYFVRLGLLVGCLLAVAGVAPAQGERRIALLIGNQGYSGDIAGLLNPHTDVALVAAALKRLKFEVQVVLDADLARLHKEINAYVRRVRAAGAGAIAFLYYAGHGAADSTGVNYLIPVDARTADDGELWDQSLRLEEITRRLKAEAPGATHLVVFDACRNELRLKKAGTKSLLAARGLKTVQAEAGMLIAFATAEGQLALDGTPGGGPYAKALAEELVKPGVEAVTMFRTVQLRVKATIGQEPWLGFSALGQLYLAGPKGPEKGSDTAGLNPGQPAKIEPPPRPSEAKEAWDAVKDSTIVAQLEAIVRRFPNTVYADFATARIEALKKQQTAYVTPPPETVKVPPSPPVAGLPPSRTAAPLTAAEERGLKAKDSFKECEECPEMVVVPAGSFMMGSSAAEIAALKWEERRYWTSEWADFEGPQHEVRIGRPIAIGKFEVTFAEWDACVTGSVGSLLARSGLDGCSKRPDDEGRGRGKMPVFNVSWEDVTKQYLPWLSRRTGHTYRLLSEAEWEYAARAGTRTRYAFGNKIRIHGVASGVGQVSISARTVGSFQPNTFGLYDMHGNVGEWVQDCWHENYRGAPVDGTAWMTAADYCHHFYRGFSSVEFGLRSASREGGRSTVSQGSWIGFRVARELAP